jgi:hypothetical protein
MSLYIRAFELSLKPILILSSYIKDLRLFSRCKTEATRWTTEELGFNVLDKQAIFSTPKHEERPWVPPRLLCYRNPRVPSPEIKQLSSLTYYLSPICADVKKKWTSTSNLSHACTDWYLLKHKDKLTFILICTDQIRTTTFSIPKRPCSPHDVLFLSFSYNIRNFFHKQH